jgi:ribonuclease J
LLLDGDIIAPADGQAMIMRRRLAHNGLLTVVLDGKGRAKVQSVGLPLEEDNDAFVTEAEQDVAAALAKLKGSAKRNVADVTEAARLAARRAAQRWSGKKPQVQVILMDS